MASKGPKPPVKPAAPKPAPRASKPATPKIEAAAPEIEKSVPPVPAPKAAPAKVAVPEVIEPVVNVAPQEVVETVEAAAEPVKAAVAETASTVEAASAAVAKPLIKEASTMEATIENTVNKSQAFFGEMNDRTKAAVEKSTKLVEDANEFAKGNIEALVESGRITAKGLETFGQDAAEYSRKQFETATAAMKSLASVKSPTEFFKLQSDFVRGAFDSYVAEASKNTEAMMKLAGDAAAPISNRFAVAVEKAKISA